MAPCHSTPLSAKAFSYTEDFEQGELVQAYSCGDGEFVLGIPTTGQGPDITFSLYKTLDSFEIIIHDLDLVLWLRGIPSLRGCLQSDADTLYSNPIENFLPILPGLGAKLVPCAISMDALLPRYPELSAKFSKYESCGLIFDALDLFVRHFLRQRSIFEVFGLKNFRQLQFFTEVHVHDICEQSRNSRFAEDLDRLDELINEIDYMRELDEPDVPVVIVVPASPIGQLERRPSQTLQCIESSVKLNLSNAIAARESSAVAEILATATGLVDAETLCHAIHFYDRTVLNHLLKHGAEIDGTDFSDGPLCAAAYAGEMEAVRQLVGYGAHVRTERSFSGSTPLEGAINGGHFKIVRYLVEKGANVNDDRQPFRLCGKTPLAQAFNLGRADIASYLVSAGADLSTIVSRIMRVDGRLEANILANLIEEMPDQKGLLPISRSAVVRYLVTLHTALGSSSADWPGLLLDQWLDRVLFWSQNEFSLGWNGHMKSDCIRERSAAYKMTAVFSMLVLYSFENEHPVFAPDICRLLFEPLDWHLSRCTIVNQTIGELEDRWRAIWLGLKVANDHPMPWWGK